jgi:hypothetical protein
MKLPPKPILDAFEKLKSTERHSELREIKTITTSTAHTVDGTNNAKNPSKPPNS